jgi:hypothetical protein
MNAKNAAMQLINEMARPDVGEASRTLELAKSLNLPPRVIVGLEMYIEAAREAGSIAQQAKRAADRASECWKVARGEAGREDDLVDLAQKSHGWELDLSPPKENPSSTDGMADPLEDLMHQVAPAAVPFFCRAWSTNEEVEEALRNMPAASHDPETCSLVVLGRASAEIIKHDMHDTVCSLIVAVFQEYLETCEGDTSEAIALKDELDRWAIVAKDVLQAVAPSVLDIYGGLVATEEAETGDLRLARAFWMQWDGLLVSNAVGAAITLELERRKKRKKAAPDDKLRGLDRAAQEGRRNWNLQGNHATAYNKPAYVQAYERGWAESQAAYDEGRAAAMSEEGSPGNPYHGKDPDSALAAAYELGVMRVVSPEMADAFEGNLGAASEYETNGEADEDGDNAS